MRKILLVFVLTLIATNCYAEWTFYRLDGEGNVHLYDKSSVKQNGDKVKVWRYVNFSPNNELAKSRNMSSMRSLEEIDCVNETMILLSLQSYTKPDLEGEMRDVGDVTDLNRPIDYIVPNSTNATLMKLVCKK